MGHEQTEPTFELCDFDLSCYEFERADGSQCAPKPSLASRRGSSRSGALIMKRSG